MTRLASLVAIVVGLTGSAAADGGRITAGVNLGVTQSKEATGTDPNNTLGLYGRLKLRGRLAAQVELQRINTQDGAGVDIRSASGLFVFDVGTSRLVPIVLGGVGIDDVASTYDSKDFLHAFAGVGLEYRADNGFTIGADVRMGARVTTAPTYKANPPVYDGTTAVALTAPSRLDEGEFRTARVTIGIRF